MATLASQVILHPLVSQALKFGSTTTGRDKASAAGDIGPYSEYVQTYRVLQYFARFWAWYLISKGDKVSAVRWTALKSHLGTARKCAPFDLCPVQLR